METSKLWYNRVVFITNLLLPAEHYSTYKNKWPIAHFCAIGHLLI